MRFDLLLTDGFLTSGVAVTLDVLAVASLMDAETGGGVGPLLARVLSRDGAPVRSSTGVSFQAQGRWSECSADYVLLFGVGMADELRIERALAATATREMIEHARAAHTRGACLAASCSSTFMLAETGLLDGGQATTCWWLAPLFRRRYADVHLDSGAMLTEHTRVLCAGAAMGQLDLALHLVRRCCGMELARICARYMIIDEERVSQTPYVIADHLARHDPLVAEAQASIKADLRAPLELRSLAKKLGVSSRTLERRFVQCTGSTPARYLQRSRADAAARLLTTSTESIARIAAQVGYADEGGLRRAFQRHIGTSPGAYRRKQRAFTAAARRR